MRNKSVVYQEGNGTEWLCEDDSHERGECGHVVELIMHADSHNGFLLLTKLMMMQAPQPRHPYSAVPVHTKTNNQGQRRVTSGFRRALQNAAPS